jgi:hypothetical protein
LDYGRVCGPELRERAFLPISVVVFFQVNFLIALVFFRSTHVFTQANKLQSEQVNAKSLFFRHANENAVFRYLRKPF